MLAPKGSNLTIHNEGTVIEFGDEEGLVLYLNRTELPVEVYEKAILTKF